MTINGDLAANKVLNLGFYAHLWCRAKATSLNFFFWGVFVFIPISYESPTGAAPLSLSDLWVADVKPLSPCPLSQLLRVTLLRIKYLLT